MSQSLVERFPAMTSWDFRRLFANGFLTSGSRWAQVLARGWLVHELSGGSTGAVGLVTFASFAPFVVVGPVAGALADRIDRRRLLIGSTAFGILGAVLLAVITLAGVVEVWQVVVLAFATGAAQAASLPARHSLIANVVPPEHLLNAVALGGISQHGSRVVGPLFGAAFLEAFGAGAVFVFSSVLLTLGLVEAGRVRHRPDAAVGPAEAGDAFDPAEAGDAFGRAEAAGQSPAGHLAELGRDIGRAGRYVGADRRLASIIALVGAHCSLTMAFDSMMPSLSVQIGGTSGLYSAILVSLGVGAITGTLGVSQLRESPARGAVFAGLGVGSGLAMVILGLATTPATVVLGALLAGSTQASYMAMSAAFIQEVVTDDYRGRVMSLYLMIAAGHMAILNLGFGRLAEVIDVRLLLVGPGLIWIILFLMSTVGMAEVRSMVRRGRFATPITRAAVS